MEQKINYQKKLDEIIQTAKESLRTPSLLLHSCCGPCSSYCLEYLTQYFDVTVLYYNPNIYPQEEYEKRLQTQKQLLDTAFAGRVSLLEAGYDHAQFLAAAKGLEQEKEGGARCEACFRLRLLKTAQIANEKGFAYFATTLTVSPHKNAMVINRIGEELQAGSGEGLLWLPSDFKKKEGYKRSIELSKQYGLYRQEYCGCEFAK